MYLYNNNQTKLIKELSYSTFSSGEYDCIIMLCKNPQLLSLLCCFDSKTTISSPYPSGTNFYYPIGAGNKFRRITIKSYQTENGLPSYWYEEVNGARLSVCRTWKSAAQFESNAILAKDQDSLDWVRQRDVSNTKLSKHSGQNFPEIVSTRRDFEYWLNENIGDNKSLLTKFGFKDFEEFKDAVNFLSPRSVKLSQENNYIWINSIPDSIANKKHIIFLSQDSSRLEEFNSDINELYLHTENKKIWKLNELPEGLQLTAKKCSATTPISIWSIR
ncbi:hypothetical protein [Moritella viscosa]|uniref:Cellulose-binding family II n=1 Tax=Moritella viscosa TaxID=80854 RepID=A0A1L0BNF6_9GAMM|nr:hypothetical protein [Moritella viscosa]SGZ05648.1 Cellulose-binding family II [Moritella viscosa]SHO13440.1 Cellulose-binding family II [Moritella viscosa]SHO14532.1 Cellulose-binding family II [Moritella viscosa]SHO15459.1 Cellulose-binding family II [Moritella viscosa]SHO19226.1 Cellulose-binding family II [Moritella viscosa]